MWVTLWSRQGVRRVTGIAAVALVLACVVYSAFWLFTARRIKAELAAYAAARRAQNIALSWQAVTVGGYPFSFRVEMTGLQVNDGANLNAAAPRLVATSASPWDLNNWSFAVPNGLNAGPGTDNLPVPKISANDATGAVSLQSGDGTTIWLTLWKAKIESGLPQLDHLAIDQAITWLILPAEPPHAASDRYVAVGADLRGIMITAGPPPFSNKLDDLSVGLVVLGPISRAPFVDAMEAWRKAGGTVKFDHYELEWDKLNIAGEGNFTLDAELQPSGSVAATIDGYDQLLTALSVAGLARASDLTQMKIGLAMIGPAISTYFTVTAGDMFLGPIHLGKAPRIEWK